MFSNHTPLRRFASAAIAAAVGIGLAIAPSASASAAASAPSQGPGTAITAVAPAAAATPVVVKAPSAKKYVGTPYRSGGTTPKGFDCSGFTSYVFKKAGVKKLPRTTSGQRHAGKKISKKHAKPGDIIYSPGHVAIYLGGNKQIDAPRPGKTIQVRRIWQKNPTFIRI